MSPVRTCVGCRGRDAQAGLVRMVVREGRVVRDGAPRGPGRGAYVHAARACLEAFARRGGFVRSLGCVVAKDVRAVFCAEFPEVVA